MRFWCSFAVSFIIFLIFVQIPGGDPAQRIAGRTATDANIADIRAKLHLDDPFYVQYWGMMQSLFDGSLKSYCEPAQRGGGDQEGDSGDVVALCRRSNHLALLRDPRRRHLCRHCGQASDRLITVLALIGISMPVFWLGPDRALPLRARPSVRDPAGRRIRAT